MSELVVRNCLTSYWADLQIQMPIESCLSFFADFCWELPKKYTVFWPNLVHKVQKVKLYVKYCFLEGTKYYRPHICQINWIRRALPLNLLVHQRRDINNYSIQRWNVQSSLYKRKYIFEEFQLNYMWYTHVRTGC